MDLKAAFGAVSVKTKKFGVVGQGISYTLSPVMHRAAFQALSLDAAYEVFDVAPPDWDDFLLQAAALPLQGFNVTVPHKERFTPGEDKDLLVHMTGAVNTVLRRDGRWVLRNTDGPGFRDDLSSLGIPVAGKKVVVLGAGGAARAVLGSFLLGEGPAEVVLINRSTEKAERLVRELPTTLREAPDESWDLLGARRPALFFSLAVARTPAEQRSAIAGASLLINATSAGRRPEDPPPVDVDALHGGLTVYDLIYHRETELITAARERGARAVGGLGMLVHQGARAFEIWFNQPPPVDAMRRAAEAELKRRTA